MPPLIAEELLLLGYDPDGIARVDATRLDCALAGALLLELMLDGTVVADGDRLSTGAARQPAHPELGRALGKITEGRTADTAIVALVPGLRRQLLANLVRRGVLGEETRRWLGVLQRHRFPEHDPSVRAEIVRRVRMRTDPRTMALAAMAMAAGLSDEISHGGQRQPDPTSVEGAMISAAVAKAVRTMRARIMT